MECKVCYNSRVLKFFKDDPDKYEAKNKREAKWKKDNPDKVKINNKRYDNAHKEVILESSKLYRENNKEAISIRNKKYADENPHKCAEKRIRRRMSELRCTPEWSESDKIKEVYKKSKWLESITGLKYHVDHIVPLQGVNVCGLHVWANLQILEASLNCSKQHLVEYIPAIKENNG
jgi:hypothetical protein